VDIVNPPDLIGFYCDQARISLRTCPRGQNAGQIIVDIVGGLQERVPRSRTWKLWEYEI